MTKETIKTMVIWLKRVLGFTAITLWMYVIYNISKSPAPFIEQAPYCMVSTMLIFGLLSMTYKGLEFWEKNQV
jgi:hypothetical protein